MTETGIEVEKRLKEEEEESEEEESLVLVELHGVIDSEILSQESFGKFNVLGIDTERPVIQVENLLFSGEYENTFGTAVFFEEEEKRLKCDPVFCKKPQRMLRYSCHTNKQLSLKRVFVSERSSEDKEGQDSEEGGTSQTQNDGMDCEMRELEEQGQGGTGVEGEAETK